MAKEMGLNPKSLIKNIPSPKEQWKQPVKIWIREMYEERKAQKNGTVATWFDTDGGKWRSLL